MLVALVALALPAMATGASLDTATTDTLDRAAAASAIRDAAGDARTYNDALALHDMLAALHAGLTPAQRAALDAAGPVPPNHMQLAQAAPTLKGVDLATAATRAQAEALGVKILVPAPVHAAPSAALFAFLAAEGAILSPEQEAQIRGLDALPPTQAASLARTIDAFAAMERSAQTVLTSGSGADWGSVLGARIALLEAVSELSEALSTQKHDPVPVPPGMVDIPPFVRMDWSTMDDQYLENYVLTLDVGGNDHYINNAGGTWIGNCDLPTFAGAAIDLGAGNDRYNDGAYRADSCGKNGGSMGGAGFLYDDLGADVYGTWGLHSGINGGARGAGAFGFLLDTDGGEYRAGGYGTNGGAAEGGVGLLVGMGSAYGGSQGTNGGASRGGIGMMLGPDYAGAGSYGTNGGAYGEDSVGFAAGMGTFSGGSYGTNGGSAQGGAGTVVGGLFFIAQDHGTNGGAEGLGTGAVYGASATYQAGSYGTNGGAVGGGRGTLIDPAARNLVARSYGTNGGAYDVGSSGFALGGMVIQGGNEGANGGASLTAVGVLIAPMGETFVAGSHGTNGGAAEGAVGTLLGGSWPSTYTAGSEGVNGGSYAGSNGLLVGGPSDDTYVAGSQGANGGAYAGGHGALIDPAGNDSYSAGSAGNGCVTGLGGTGLLLDVQGSDTYNGAPNDTATCGNGGARIDASPL